MLVNITKKTVIVFVIGLLIGAIIATSGFLIFSKTCKSRDDSMGKPNFSQSQLSELPGSNNNNGNSTENGMPPQMPNFNNSNGGGNQNGQPPQMQNSDSNGMPQLPDMNNSSNSN